jgi:hypothetical protein
LRLQLRTAYASLGGASWLESLARLLGGAPVAAKLAALGVGAATVTGGAVVVPQVIEQSGSRLPPVRAHLPARHAPKLRGEAATPAPVVMPPKAPRYLLVPGASDDRSTAHETAEDAPHEGTEGGQAVRSGRDGPDGGSATTPGQTTLDEKGSVQHEGGDGEEAAVTVQTETQPLETTTTDGHGGGGSDGGSSGRD